MKTKETKRQEAAERQAHWDSLSRKKKLADLDRRLGKGIGAVKQRAKLMEETYEDSETE